MKTAATKAPKATSPAPEQFCHLHVHSEFSSLDGACKIKDLVALAKERGHTAIGLSDHGTISGLPAFEKACRAEGIKPILSCEIYLTDDRHIHKRETKTWHLGLIARTDEGLHNLYALTSWAYIEGYFGGRPRADWELLERHKEGIIALTGCMAAPVMNAIFQGDLTQARAHTQRLIDIYGADNVYGEIQDAGIVEQIPADSELAHKLGKFTLSQEEANHELAEICRDLGLPLVATGDVHYLNKTDAIPHDALLCVGTGQLQERGADGKPDLANRRFSLLPKHYHFRTEAEMRDNMPHYPEAFENSLKLAERCDASIDYGKPMLPRFPIPDGFEDSDEYLRALCEEGMERRYGPRETQTAEQRERLEFELGVIGRMGFNDYFLIVEDFVREAQRRGIPSGPGRGSAAGSIVAYVLDITHLDPLKYGLLFERFLNPDRVSMPDVDWDVSIVRRGEMIEYAKEKYNSLAGCETAVSQIVTHSMIGAKAALRDAARVLGKPIALANKLCSMVPAKPVGVSLRDTYAGVPDFRRAFASTPDAKEVITLAGWMEGYVRGEGIHAAGVVIWDQPLERALPLQRKGKNEPITTAWDMKISEAVGTLKMDFLGLRNLDIIQRAVEIVQHTEGITLDPYALPLDDKGTFEMLARGEAIGVFQLESGGMREALRLIRPSTFDDIIALVALYRPGPMEYIPTYAARKHGKEETTFLDPRLEPITGPTHGICLTGDTIVTDVKTGRRLRLDEVRPEDGIELQGVDPDTWAPATGRVSAFMDNGIRPVSELVLSGGARVRATGNHEFLTQRGWKRLDQLAPGDLIATPAVDVAEGAVSGARSEARMRTFGMLLGDGGLTNGIPNFYSADPTMRDIFMRSCEAGFGPHRFNERVGVRGVVRVEVGKPAGHGGAYHSVSPFESELRDIGLRWKRDEHGRHGARSEEKFVPEEVFQANDRGIAIFLAGLFDCDGHVGTQGAFLKTISSRLAADVKTLLLRLGIRTRIYEYRYDNPSGSSQTSYQVGVHDTREFVAIVQPHMLSYKAHGQVSLASRGSSVERALVREELMAAGVALKPLAHKARLSVSFASPRMLERSPTISQSSLEKVLPFVNAPALERLMNTGWDRIVSITPYGSERVFDITVDGIHSFVASGVIVHNCTFQEQNMTIAKDIANFTPGEADTLRKAIGKKNAELMATLKPKFIKGCMDNGLTKATSEQLWTDNERSADYSFNKSHAACYGLIAYITAYLKHNHPAAYMAALISLNAGTKDKVPFFITEARRMGLRVLPPDLNRSLRDFAVMEADGAGPDTPKHERFEVLFGLQAIKGVGANVISAIRSERDSHGPYRSLLDLSRRVPTLNRSVLERLITAGALDFTGHSRKAMFEAVDPMLKEAKKQALARAKAFQGKVAEGILAARASKADELTLLDGAAAGTGKAAKLTTMEKRGMEAVAKVAHQERAVPTLAAARAACAEALEREALRVARLAARKAEADDPDAVAQAQVAAAADERAQVARDLGQEAHAAAAAALAVADNDEDEIETALDDQLLLAQMSGPDWPALERLARERGVLGLYASGHPLDASRRQWQRYISHTLGSLAGSHIGSVVTVVGAITGERILKKKTGERFGVEVEMEDLTGSRPVTFFDDALKDVDTSLLEPGSLCTIKAKVVEDAFRNSRRDEEAEEDGDVAEGDKAIKLNGLSVHPWLPDKVDMTPIRPLEVALPEARRTAKDLARLSEILRSHSGPSPVYLLLGDARHRMRERVTIGPTLERELARLLRTAAG